MVEILLSNLISLSPQVSEEMLHAAFPNGIPGEGGDQSVTVDLTEEEEEEEGVKLEVKQEE